MSTQLKIAPRVEAKVKGSSDASTILKNSRTNELFIAVVGAVGSGTSIVAKLIEQAGLGKEYTSYQVKLSECIKENAHQNGFDVPSGNKTLDYVKSMQDLGDNFRSSDKSSVARMAIKKIQEIREKNGHSHLSEDGEIIIDDKKRIFIIDSLRHPDEVNLLRRVYYTSFALVGVVCEDSVRKNRLQEKYISEDFVGNSDVIINNFMDRDSDDGVSPHGQHVRDAFYLADFFVDTTIDVEKQEDNTVVDGLGRLISILIHDTIVRPVMAETAMHHAHSARVRSACLSRQVGAALVQSDGTVIATGTNEVPRAGGGVYGERDDGEEDHRCAFHPDGRYCRSTKKQNEIVDELFSAISQLGTLDSATKDEVRNKVKKTRLGQLIEFSRAVHAEMDTLVSAARSGVSTKGTKLFVTTFPCHYCARHIVSAGVGEVQYIEPYPKSLALELHSDAIVVASELPSKANVEGKEPTLVLFKPFVGVAPRMYVRAFEQNRPLKDKGTGEMSLGSPVWGGAFSQHADGYPALEKKLAL